MLLYRWTQFNTQKLGAMFLHRSGKWRHLLQLLKGTVSKRVAPFVLGEKQKYEHKFIIKRFTSGFIADHNVHRNNNFFSVA